MSAILTLVAFAKAGTKAGKAIARANVANTTADHVEAFKASGDISGIADTRYTLGDTLKYGKGKGRADAAAWLKKAGEFADAVSAVVEMKGSWRAAAMIGALRAVEAFARADALPADWTALFLSRLEAIDAGKPKAEKPADGSTTTADGSTTTATTASADGDGDGDGSATNEQVIPRTEFDAMKARAVTAETAAREANNRAENLQTALTAARATIERQAAELAAAYDRIGTLEKAAVQPAAVQPAAVQPAAVQPAASRKGKSAALAVA